MPEGIYSSVIQGNYDGNPERVEVKIAIALTCYNQWEYTRRGLDSLIQSVQDTKHNIEMWLLDDASTDETQREVKKYLPKIRYYRTPKQSGLTTLWNVAYQLTGGNEYIAICNNDLLFPAGWIDKVISAMGDHHDWAGPITNAPGHCIYQNIRNYVSKFTVSETPVDIAKANDQILHNQSFCAPYVNGFCMVFRREFLVTNRLPGNKPFDEKNFPLMGNEDEFLRRTQESPLIVSNVYIFHYKAVSVNKTEYNNQFYRAKPRVTVVIPSRPGESITNTIDSLDRQTFKDFQVMHIIDRDRSANIARNRGFKSVDTELTLFSDSDIEWSPLALATMIETLDNHPDAAYVYGAYLKDGKTYCTEKFDADLLKKKNYISTMSLIRTDAFPGFDESVQRLQDWDVWLTMLEQNKTGIQCESIIFTTHPHPGISQGESMSWAKAESIVKTKHGLF
tara:strand:- start:876 stop:2225 length:1350 start_codon:yes stop_codon:yes gene_type:complete